MPTSIEIAARKAALLAVKDSFNGINSSSAALLPFSTEFQPLVVKFNGVTDALSDARADIVAAIAATDALVPSDPPPPFGAWFAPPLTLNAGSSIDVTQYYSGPPGVFGANNLPTGVTINAAGLLTAAADAPASNSTVTFTRSDA